MPVWTRYPKIYGERSESAFQLAALEHGLVVSKPFGDSAPYDFIVDGGPYQGKPSRLFRVQVRSTGCHDCSGWYHVSVRLNHQSRPFTDAEIDFFVVFIPPLKVWYLMPVKALRVEVGIALRPRPGTRSRWEPYREAWHLLGGAEFQGEPPRRRMPRAKRYGFTR